MGIAITQVDAFTSKPFAGNLATVYILPGAPDERWMWDLAR
jgi:predicted PhzF superfamily epimerase YddE/YHI9